MKNKGLPRGIGIRAYKKKITISLFYRCGCGKYNHGIRYRGIICDKCGIEIKHETKIDIPRETINYYLLNVGQISGKLTH